MSVAEAPTQGERLRFAKAAPSLKTIAQRMRRVREMRGYSITEASALLDVAKQTISQWEHADCHPGMANLVKFGEVMRVDLGDLFRGLTPLTPIKTRTHGLRLATQLVPLVTLRTAGAYLMHTAELPETVKRIPTVRHHPKGSIAFTISGRSFEPWGREGDVITLVPVEEGQKVDAGKLVLAHIEGRPDPIVFRRYLPKVEGQNIQGAMLRSLNGVDPDIVMKTGDRLLGVMLEHISTRHD
jgi:DNA-binding XRE family transcriptional regulator